MSPSVQQIVKGTSRKNSELEKEKKSMKGLIEYLQIDVIFRNSIFFFQTKKICF